MQEIAHKHGGLELMHQYIKEEDDSNKEQVISALSSLIRTPYTAVKAEFFTEMKGLDWIKQIILEPSTTKKALRRIYFMLYDLITKETDKNIDTVLYNDNLIKEYLVSNKEIIKAMLNSLDYSLDDTLVAEIPLREF